MRNNIAVNMREYKNFINAVIIAVYNDCTVTFYDKNWRTGDLLRREIEYCYRRKKRPIMIAVTFPNHNMHSGRTKRRFFTTEDIILYLICQANKELKQITCYGDKNYHGQNIKQFIKYVNEEINAGRFIIPADYIIR